MKNKRGITLVALVITIIVMLILVAVTITITSNGGLFDSAKKAVFQQEISKYKEELEAYKGGHYEEISNTPINETNYENIKKYIPSFEQKYGDRLKILENQLIYLDVGNVKETKWAEQLGLDVRYEKALIKVEIEGEGTVEGATKEGTEYNLDSKEKLIAKPTNKIINGEEVQLEFEGWYLNGELVSTDLEYTITIVEDRTYIAKFIPNASLIYYSDGKIDIDENEKLGSKSEYTAKDIIKVETGKVCTEIGNAAFKNCTNLQEIDLSQNTAKIGTSTFYGCTNLEVANLSDNITTIGQYGFYKCSKLKISKIPNKCTTIGGYAFYNCSSLEKLTIDTENAVKILGYAFQNCSGLKEVEILKPDFNVTSDCQGYQFAKCSNIEKIIIGSINNPISTIAGYTFDGCTNEKLEIKIYVPDEQKEITTTNWWGAKNSTIYYYNTKNELVNEILGCKYKGDTQIDFTNIPNENVITLIKSNAFKGCTNLALTTLPEQTISIGEYAFYNCENLKIEQIPDKCTSIQGHAFCNCSGITKLIINTENSIKILGYAFQNCKGIKEIEIVKPDFNTASDLQGYQFAGCSNVEKIKLGNIQNPVTSIANYTFDGCRKQGLEFNIYIPDGQTEIENTNLWGASNCVLTYYNAMTGEKI